MADTAQHTEQSVRWLTDEEVRGLFDAGDFTDLHDDRENIDFVG